MSARPLRASRAKPAAQSAGWTVRARQQLERMPPRERRMVLLCIAAVTAALIWWVLLAPALATLRQAEASQRDLDAQWQTVSSLQAQAQALQSASKLSPEVARKALEESVQTKLGESGKLQWLGERAQVQLTNVPAHVLAQWLAQARTDARALPVQASLSRGEGTDASWSGQLILGLPQP